MAESRAPESGFASVNGTRLYYEAAGQGEPERVNRLTLEFLAKQR